MVHLLIHYSFWFFSLNIVELKHNPSLFLCFFLLFPSAEVCLWPKCSVLAWTWLKIIPSHLFPFLPSCTSTTYSVVLLKSHGPCCKWLSGASCPRPRLQHGDVPANQPEACKWQVWATLLESFLTFCSWNCFYTLVFLPSPYLCLFRTC